ncbi:MAG: GIY-YIG nuclease family protein [Minisyncoccia bacterium]
MKSQYIKKLNLPDLPGVYFFKRGSEILYIGKATSLRDRVRSYFANDLIATRGPLLVDMVTKTDRIDFEVTDSVLEALILEASLIKKHTPYYNTKEKDDKSFNWVVITKEDFPRVLTIRGRELEKDFDFPISEKFGPFTQSNSLKEALRIIRKIFPFRSECALNLNRPCFNYQIGLCPGTCSGLISKRDYNKIIRHLKYFLSGRKKTLVKELNSEMKTLAKEHKFEEANVVKRTLFAPQHIQDVALIKNDSLTNIRMDEYNESTNEYHTNNKFRIEAYDVAHHAGAAEIGVMVVSENGELTPQKYRLFNIKDSQRDDLAALRELIIRRLNHPEWTLPDLIVVDGDKRQIKVATQILTDKNLTMPVVSVVKNEKHQPKAIIGSTSITKKYSKQILEINGEAHRFAIGAHRRQLRKKSLL